MYCEGEQVPKANVDKSIFTGQKQAPRQIWNVLWYAPVVVTHGWALLLILVLQALKKYIIHC